MAPSTDGSFINITEWWWHQGLFSTSCGWRRTSGHKHTLNMHCFSNHLTQNVFNNPAHLCHEPDTFRWQGPQRMPLSKLKVYYSGVNGILVLVTLWERQWTSFLKSISFICEQWKVGITHQFQRCPAHSEKPRVKLSLSQTSTVTPAFVDTILWFHLLNNNSNNNNMWFWKTTRRPTCICSPGRKELIKCPSRESTRELPARSNAQNKSARQSPTEFWIPTSKHE